jgi:hypothetical protein
MTRSERIQIARTEHAAEHSVCKTVRGPHEVYQRLCHDPCHHTKRAK